TFTNLFASSAPTLVGGGGGAGSTSISIVPWLFANNASGVTLNATTNTLVTYGANGFRPLDTSTEFATSLSAGSPANVRIGLTTNNSPVTVNALNLTGFNVNGTGTVTIGSGAVLVSGLGGTYSVPLEFGSTEAIFHTSSSGSFSGVINGTNGLT